MGREIRMVPPHWAHPRNERGHLQSMHNRTFKEAAAEWKAEFAAWEAWKAGSGPMPDLASEKDRDLEFWEWHGTPPEDRAYYRPWKDEEATWFQVWETESEGSPVTPPFATREELAAHLAKHGDDWGAGRRNSGWGKAAADAFVADGWAPSMMMVEGPSGRTLLESKDIPLYFQEHPK